MISHKDFIENKYWRWYCVIISRARSRKIVDRGEWHHIIPSSFKGSNETVLLTYREHFIAHWLLTKFTRGVAQRKMNGAFGMMIVSGGNVSRPFTQWQYERARLAISVSMVGNRRSLGYRHTAEAKERIRISHIGNKHTLGYKHTSESSLKMIKAQTGNKKWLGKRHTEETKKKMSISERNRTRSVDGTYSSSGSIDAMHVQAARIHN